MITREDEGENAVDKGVWKYEGEREKDQLNYALLSLNLHHIFPSLSFSLQVITRESDGENSVDKGVWKYERERGKWIHTKFFLT